MALARVVSFDGVSTLLEDRKVSAQLAGIEGWHDDLPPPPIDHPLRRSRPEIATPCHGVLLSPRPNA